MVNKATTRVVVLEGSARASKTVSILQYLILECIQSKTSVTIARAKLTWAKASVLVDFLWVLDEHFKLYNPNNFNKTESIYTFENGSIISFIGLDEENKLRGRRQDISYLNEGLEAEYDSYQQLAIRTTRKIIVCYNPSAVIHWLYDRVIPRDDCTFIKVTFKNNPFLPVEIKNEILRLEPTEENIRNGTADETAWLIFGLGQRAAYKGLIFPEWNIVDSFPTSDEWKLRVYGLDFGFSADPTAMVELVYARGEIWVRELIYKKGLTNIRNPNNPDQESIEENLIKLGVDKKTVIYADSAEPKSIQDLNNCGFYVVGIDKGPDSIISGIKTLKRFKVNIHSSSMNLIKEKNMYRWCENKDGTFQDKPKPMWDHLCDATRYAAWMELRDHGEVNKAFNPKDKAINRPSFMDKVKKPQKEGYFS